MNHDDTLAAGLLAGYAHGLELRKLASRYLLEKLGGEPEVAKRFGSKALELLKNYGNHAMLAGIGTTVGTVVGHQINERQDRKKNPADLQLAVAAPNIFRAGYEEGLRNGLEAGTGGAK